MLLSTSVQESNARNIKRRALEFLEAPVDFDSSSSISDSASHSIERREANPDKSSSSESIEESDLNLRKKRSLYKYGDSSSSSSEER